MNDTVIFLVLAGIAVIFKWLSQGSGDAKKPSPPSPNKPIQRAPPESEEERVRRFLEALGVPTGSPPPPLVRPRTITPRPVAGGPPPKKIKRSWAQPLPPLVTTPEEVLPPPVVPEPVFVEMPPAPVAALPSPPPAEVSLPSSSKRPIAKPKLARAFPGSSLGSILRSREQIRQAIILREVLGPPKGLEPFGQLPGY
jgi:hypothetical protein